MITCYYSGRLYMKTGGSWSEKQPGDAYAHAWNTCRINESGEAIAGMSNGRLYHYNGSSWSETQPIGDVDGSWFVARINNNGEMVVLGNGKRI